MFMALSTSNRVCRQSSQTKKLLLHNEGAPGLLFCRERSFHSALATPGRCFACTGNPFLGSVWRRWTSNFCAKQIAESTVSGRQVILEKLWSEFFSDTSQWWDHRSEKVNPRYPDFKHKRTQQPLWVIDKSNPPWVGAELAALPSGALQSSIFTWNARLRRHVKAAEYKKTLELFRQMQRERMIPDKFTFLPVLNACSSLGALDDGRHIHSQIVQSGLECNMFVSSCLVDMYAKCRSMHDARGVFDKMPTRDVVAWSAMILGYVKCGQGHEALELSRQMQRDGLDLDPGTFVGVLNACASIAAIEHGRHVHEQIIDKGFESDVYVAGSLVDMYAKCGSLEDARKVFDNMPRRNSAAWSAMILGYVKCGQGQEALELSRQMQQEGVNLDAGTFVGVLNACASAKALEEGRRAHEQIIDRGYESDIYVASSLVDMYAKCGSIEDARRVFSRVPRRDVVTWNAMLLGYVKCEQGREALELFRLMQKEGLEPTPVTFIGVLNACASTVALEEGRRTHKQIIDRGYKSDVYVSSSLVDMYAKCGSVADAWRVFSEMPTKEVVTWNAMILGYAKSGQGREALQLFRLMQQEGVNSDAITFVGVLTACASIAASEEGRRVHEQIIDSGYESDIYVASSLVDMYAKCGSLEDARTVFDNISKKDIVSWSAIILGYVKCGQGQGALELYQEMRQEQMGLDPVTFVAVLKACTSIGALQEGRRAHEQIIERGYESDVYVASSLIDMYAKCGSLEDAQKVFSRMPSRDVVPWSAMLAGYGLHGYCKEALEGFQQMCQEEVEVNGVTFISLLSACSHGGLVDEGMHYFESMSAVFNVCPTAEHYACLVDLLGRAGRLYDAEDLIRSMPCQPDATVWMSLLGSCRAHQNVEMGECAANQLLKFDSQNAAGYMLLVSLYAATGKWDRVQAVHLERLRRGVDRVPERTWIEIGNKVHSFVVDDKQHPQGLEIHAELERLAQEMEAAGCVPDTRFVLHCRDGEESHLCYHSEKLAIAFGLINTAPGTSLCIVKNLPICGDCTWAANSPASSSVAAAPAATPGATLPSSLLQA